jgi:YrbI family 3-deoxy-D-manno-octulosonate 8-phosphate phosphatase
MILGVIPARGGSKGVPRKNIRTIMGKPLIAWSIEAATASKHLDDFVVSTDDAEIAAISRAYGAKVIDRPRALATDEATTVSALQHVLSVRPADAVVVLQPTSPIRDAGLIDACVERFRKTRPDNLATGFLCKFREYGTYDNLRRQDLKGFFYDDGNVYVLKKELIKAGRWTGRRIERFMIEGAQNHEIDTEDDFLVVERLLELRLIHSLRSRPKRVKLLALDVDGVLTDAGMYYSESGDELKKFNTRDGKGLELLRGLGIKTAIVTSERTELVRRRAAKLKIDFLHQGVNAKLDVLKKIARAARVELSEIAYVGDDLNDTEVLASVGFAAVPQDGVIENKRVADYVCRLKGGEGCVREVADLIVAASR